MRNELSGKYIIFTKSKLSLPENTREMGKLAYPKWVVFPCHYSFLDISKRSVRESSNRFEAANSVRKKKIYSRRIGHVVNFSAKQRRKKWQMQND